MDGLQSVAFKGCESASLIDLQNVVKSMGRTEMSCNFVNFCYLWTSKKKVDSTVLFCADVLEIIQLRKNSQRGLVSTEMIIMAILKWQNKNSIWHCTIFCNVYLFAQTRVKRSRLVIPTILAKRRACQEIQSLYIRFLIIQG